MGQNVGECKVSVGIPEGNIDLDEMIILKFILEKYDWELWTRFIWLKIETNDGIM